MSLTRLPRSGFRLWAKMFETVFASQRATSKVKVDCFILAIVTSAHSLRVGLFRLLVVGRLVVRRRLPGAIGWRLFLHDRRSGRSRG